MTLVWVVLIVMLGLIVLGTIGGAVRLGESKNIIKNTECFECQELHDRHF